MTLDTPTYSLQQGLPLLISIPHLGTELPPEFRIGVTPELREAEQKLRAESAARDK